MCSIQGAVGKALLDDVPCAWEEAYVGDGLQIHTAEAMLLHVLQHVTYASYQYTLSLSSYLLISIAELIHSYRC